MELNRWSGNQLRWFSCADHRIGQIADLSPGDDTAIHLAELADEFSSLPVWPMSRREAMPHLRCRPWPSFARSMAFDCRYGYSLPGFGLA